MQRNLLTIIEIRKRQPKNLVYLMKKEGFKNLTHSGHIKDKRSREKATRGPLDKFEQIGWKNKYHQDTGIIEDNKKQKVVENHFCSYFEETWYLKSDYYSFIFVFYHYVKEFSSKQFTKYYKHLDGWRKNQWSVFLMDLCISFLFSSFQNKFKK